MAEQVSKIKKKLWYPIVAPKMFENAVLGETIVYDPNAMIGKTLTASLMNLIHDVKRQNVNIHFKVVGVEDGKATTSIVGYQIVSSSVKRLVRRNSEKINLSFACDTSDNVMMRVKPIVITRSAVKGSVQAKLRHNIVNFLVKSIKKLTYEEFMQSIISHKLQESMREILNKIYPVKTCEIRFAGLEKVDKPREVKAEAPVVQ